METKIDNTHQNSKRIRLTTCVGGKSYQLSIVQEINIYPFYQIRIRHIK